MTAANSAANGASLEDCHTNLFALTDLSGIKWRKFSYDCPQEPLGPLEDPVLVSYSRCIAANILSVWRRVPFMNTDLLLSLDVPMKPDPIWTKELWIYWYGDDPNLEEKISPDLKEVDEGTWDNGLSYECRTLLFKSLHNLIERCLLSHNYVHLGKWFVRPYDSLPASPDSFNDHLSFAFSFFLHGESTVCANVEVALHQPVCRLSLDHLALAQGSATGFQVILSPYGLSGVLTGHSYKASHSASRRILNEWHHFYPIKFQGDEESRDTPLDEDSLEDGLPAVVDVLVAGVRMLYPTAYVLVPQSEEMAHVPIAPMPGTTYLPPPPVQNAGARIHGITAAAMSSISLTPPTSPPDQPLPGEAKITMVSSGVYASAPDPALFPAESDLLSPQMLAGRMAGRLWRELTVPAPEVPSSQTVAAPSVDSSVLPSEDGSTAAATVPAAETRSTATNTTVTWDFNDPSTRANCSCSRQKSLKQKGGLAFSKSHPSSHMSSKHSKSDSKQERQQRNQRPVTPFHHRTITCEDILALEQEAVNQRLAAQQSALPSLPAGAATGQAQPQPLQQQQQDSKLTQGKFTQPSPAAFRPMGPVDSVLTESPPSVVPSPLLPPPTGATTSANERTMPALSPYPPPRSGSDSGTPTATSAPAIFARSDAIPVNQDHPDGLPVPPMMGTAQMMDSIPRGMDAHLMAEHQKEEREEDPLWQCFKLPSGLDCKRPLLPAQCYELDDADGGGWDALYEMDNNIEVFSQPLKKLKPERPLLTNQDLLSGNFSVDQLEYKPAQRAASPEPVDPYEFMEHDPSPTSRVISYRSRGKDVKGKPKGLAPRRNSNRKERKKLEEEAVRRAEEEKMKQEQMAQEQMQSNSVDDKGPMSNQSVGRLDSSSLMQVNDLKVTYEDLEQLFQPSDDDDDGGPFEDKSLGPPSEEAKPLPGNTGPVGGAYNSATELAVMFPTPPSLEQQNSAFSPLNQPCQEYLNHGSVAGLTQIEQSSLGDISEVEVDDTMGSPKPDSIEDWSYVYKTPMIERFVGASMYAPLKSLPSSKLPPLRIPENCIYKPSWQIPLSPKPEFIPTTKESATSGGGQLMNSPASAAVPVGVYPPGSQGPRSVANTDIAPSPASEASSYIKNLNSLESASLGSNIPEAHSLTVNLVLSDSQLNLFKDRNFDSCVICACNMTIRGSEAAAAPGYDTLGPCSCGFSAVMNRRYGTGSGLFAEDESEITGQYGDVALWAYHRDNPMLAADFARKDPLAQEGGLTRLYTRDGVPVGTDILRTSNALLRLIQDQCNTPYSTLCRLNCIAKRKNINSSGQLARSQLEIEDGCEVCFAALEQGRQVAENSSNAKLDDTLLKNSCLHSWPYTPGLYRSQLSSQDIVRTLSSLQPLLQDAIQKKRTTRLWERPYTVQGPLTWQVFFNLAAKGSSESPEPLPIPPLLVGYDKDWLSSSPYALHNWEKLLLEPYSTARDIAYVALVPDNDFILQCAKSFFREVTAVYESCRLGRHAPIAKTQRDGIFRIGSKYASKVAEEPVDDWFSEIAHLPDSCKLKLYAQVCKAYVGPFLSGDPPDHTLFTTSRHDRSSSSSSSSALSNLSNVPGSTSVVPGGTHHLAGAGQGGGSGVAGMGSSQGSGGVSSSMSQGMSSGDGLGSVAGAGSQQGNMNMPAPSTTGPAGTGSQQDASSCSDKSDSKENETGISIPEDSDCEKPPAPAVVVYIVNPFGLEEEDYGGGGGVEQSVSSLALLKSFAEVQNHVQGELRRNLILQIIPLRQILQVANSDMSSRLLSQIKCHAFSVFSQSRRHLQPSVAGQSLTGFGPAAELDRILKSNKGPKPQYRLYSPPYILTPLKDKQTELGESFGELRQACCELFCGYCLSHDQRLLLVACTDSKGEMMETQVINIDVPNRKRRKKVCVRNIALIKLWDFLMGVMSKTAVPWRLVVGRFGRLGQGELRDWSALLSRRSLTTQSRTLKDMCNMCNVTGNNDYPCILSACLVSMEPEPGLRIMADSVAADKCSKNAQRDQPSCQLHTPDDATCTHIHVFPTSATKQVASGPYQAEPMMDLSFTNPTDNVLPADDDLLFITEGLGNQDLAQILGLGSPTNMGSPVPSPGGGGHSPGPSSPSGQQMNMAVNSENMNKNTNQQLLPTEPEESLLQQPLAMGFFVSTAKTGPLPDWFWSSCPEAENNCPVFLKAALHLHNASVQQMSDDILQTKHNHPLDSNLTTDVLRYVLESYNSLSWLTVDPASGDRRSCLPIHLVVLMQLYNTIAALF